MARAIDLRDVAMTYGGRDGQMMVHALEGIDVAVDAGEMVVIAGRSGSGKTSLLLIAAGILRPTRGEVRWSGSTLNGMDPDGLAKLRGRTIGVVFQNAALIDTLTAAENIALSAIPSGLRTSRRRAMELLAAQGLEHRAGHFPHQLSGGEQQRVALCRALYADPPVLIVDEPTANLDRRTADSVIDLLRTLTSEGRAVMVASHDTHVISSGTRTLELETSTAGQPSGPRAGSPFLRRG